VAWTQQLQSGKWRGLYRDRDGKTRSAGTHAHKSKALAMATQREEEARLPGWRDPAAGARKWSDWHPEWWAAHDVAPSTKRADASLIKNHIEPHWGDVALVDITRHAVKEWVVVLKGKKLAESTVARAVRVFSSSLSAAVDAEIIKTNPTFKLGLEPGETDVMRFFTRKQIAKMMKKLKARPRDRAILALLVGCGLRWGEMAGLAPERVDLKRKMLRVTHVRDQATGQIKKYPKSRKIRDVPIPDWVAAEIKPYVKAGGPFVFQYTNSSNWRRDVWTPFGPGGRIHDLRHTFASWLLQGGMSIQEVSKLMGHSSIRVTERYAHLAVVPSEKFMSAMADPRV
jgi:integrase